MWNSQGMLFNTFGMEYDKDCFWRVIPNSGSWYAVYDLSLSEWNDVCLYLTCLIKYNGTLAIECLL